jgi:adenylosuccinate synthase
MSITVVCGVNWGDEGKGRMVDYLAGDADVVVRYQGGNNAGHTVVNDLGTFKLHLLPSGIFNPKVMNVLGPGMVIDLESLVNELDDIGAGGIDVSNVRVSDRATICLPINRNEDVWEETRLGKNAFGSTRRGIAPAYADRYLKKALQVGEVLDAAALKPRVRALYDWKCRIAEDLYKQDIGCTFEDLMDWVQSYGEKVRPLICDTSVLLDTAASDGKNILLEAQLGALRDVFYGIYPFTTSSSTLASFAAVGSGLFSHQPDSVVGVMKAFSSCVGAGPFVTEMDEDEAKALRESSNEFGASTGRPRRIGHFDAFASRYGAQLQGATEIALTKLDSISGRKSLKICTHYEVDGRALAAFPLNPVLERARPVYAELEGWDADISKCRSWRALPEPARAYTRTIEGLIGFPIRYISVGPERDALILRD